MDAELEVAVITVGFFNELLIGEIIVEKKCETLVGFDTDFLYAYVNMANTKYNVYAYEDKYYVVESSAKEGYIINKTTIEAKDKLGNVVIKAETLVGKAQDLPLAKCYIKELQAPTGYVKSDAVYDIDATSQDDETLIYEIVAQCDNYHTTVEFSKIDVTGVNELDETVHTVELKCKGNAPEVVEYTLSISNEQKYDPHKTGDVTPIMMWPFLGGGSLSRALLLILTGKRRV